MPLPAQDRFRLFAILIVCTFIGNVAAQFIVAGELGSNDHYQDPEPDLARTLFSEGSEGDALDMDGDGSTDVVMIAWRDWITSPHYQANVHVGFGTDVSIATGGPSCGPSYGHRFVQGDTIDGSATWTSSPVHVIVRVEGGECPYWYGESGFIGVRLTHASDTLYGWIRLHATSYPAYTLYEFACNSGITGLTRANGTSGWFRYDETWSALIIQLGVPVHGQWSVDICDAQGRRVMVVSGEGEGQRIEVPLHGLSTGVYIFSVRSNTGAVLSDRFAVVGAAR